MSQPITHLIRKQKRASHQLYSPFDYVAFCGDKNAVAFSYQKASITCEFCKARKKVRK